MTFWWGNGNKCISIHFYPQHIKLGFNIYTNKARKFIDSCYDKNIQFFGLFISYTNFEYNDIVHVMLTPEHNYSKTDQAHNVAVLRESLNAIADDSDRCCKPPFSFAYESTDDIYQNIYYITGKREWFVKNNLTVLLPGPLIEPYNVELENNKNKFPKYHKTRTEVIYLS